MNNFNRLKTKVSKLEGNNYIYDINALPKDVKRFLFEKEDKLFLVLYLNDIKNWIGIYSSGVLFMQNMKVRFLEFLKIKNVKLLEFSSERPQVIDYNKTQYQTLVLETDSLDNFQIKFKESSDLFSVMRIVKYGVQLSEIEKRKIQD